MGGGFGDDERATVERGADFGGLGLPADVGGLAVDGDEAQPEGLAVGAAPGLGSDFPRGGLVGHGGRGERVPAQFAKHAGLEPARGEPLLDALPQERPGLLRNHAVEDAARQVRVGEVGVDGTGLVDGLAEVGGRETRAAHAEDGGGDLGGGEDFGGVPGGELAVAAGILREEDGLHPGRGGDERLGVLPPFGGDDELRLEGGGGADAEGARREVAEGAGDGLHSEVGAEEGGHGGGLGGGFDDDKFAWHGNAILVSSSRGRRADLEAGSGSASSPAR